MFFISFQEKLLIPHTLMAFLCVSLNIMRNTFVGDDALRSRRGSYSNNLLAYFPVLNDFFFLVAFLVMLVDTKLHLS
jgi:hypothetical protein